MPNYVLSCCTTADLSTSQYKDLGLKYIPFHYELGGTWHLDTPADFDPSKFYGQMASGASTSTASVSVKEYIDYFTEFVKQGQDILHVSLSSGISVTSSAAVGAASILRVNYPERRIYVVDSLCASSGYGLLMDKASELRAAGMGIDELKEWIEDNRLRVNHLFFSTDLSYYVRGGRISKAAGYIGTQFDICPLLDVNASGELDIIQKIRTKRRTIEQAEALMERNADGGASYADKIFISHSDTLADAEALKTLIERRFKNAAGNITINPIGTTIGAHTGPGTVALFFWGKARA